jgi:NTE family protein
MAPREPLGLVLSGGGVRGAAHAGVLKVFEEEGVEVGCISGTSAGAVAGALWAAGRTADQVSEFFRETKIFQASSFSLLKPGLLDSEDYVPWLESALGDTTFESLEVELFVTVTDLLQGRWTVFDSGPVVPAVQASAAVPMIFTPVEIGDGLYADGGILNNFPIEPLVDRCETIFGVNVVPLREVERTDLDGVIDVLVRVHDLGIRYDTARKIERCDWLVEPEDVLRFNIFAMDRADEVFEIGYQAALPVVREMLSG